MDVSLGLQSGKGGAHIGPHRWPVVFLNICQFCNVKASSTVNMTRDGPWTMKHGGMTMAMDCRTCEDISTRTPREAENLETAQRICEFVSNRRTGGLYSNELP